MSADESREQFWNTLRSQKAASCLLVSKIIQDGSSFSVYKQEESLKLHYLGKCALQDTSSQIPIFPFSRKLFHKRLQTFIHTESIEGQPKPFLFQHINTTAEFSSRPRLSPNCFISSRRYFLRILQLYSNCGLNENQN